MALSNDIRSAMMADYYQSGEVKEIPFGASEAEVKRFFDWFGQAASQWHISDDALPNPSMHSTSNACFTNAQRNALVTGMDYCEGFYKEEGESYSVHAFNLDNGTVLDFTTINNRSDTDIEYYGIVIPNEQIERYNPGVSIGEGESLGSILYQFYLDNH